MKNLFIWFATLSCSELTCGSMLNPDQGISIFSNLSCYRGNESELFDVGSASPVGVGILPNIVFIPNDTGNNISSNSQKVDLSLSLIDGWPSGDIGLEQTSTKGLYLGVPPNLDLANKPPACALMMQYRGQTFPNRSYNPLPDNTSCPMGFTGTLINDQTPRCLLDLMDTLSDFQYKGNSERFPRCQALAQHVEAFVRDRGRTNICQYPYKGSGISVYGAAISGPDAETTQAWSFDSVYRDRRFRMDPETFPCQPVQPQDYELYHVMNMTQILYPNSEASDEISDEQERANGGGRTGFTPIVTVVWEDGEDQDPDAKFWCVRLRSPEGNELPSQLPPYTNERIDSGGVRSAHFQKAIWITAAGAAMMFML